MAFRVARMARVKSGAFIARKGIPEDVRDTYAALYGKGWEERFRARPDCTPQRAKALRGEWEAEIETRIAAIRAKQRGEGHDLTQKQAQALAGEWYMWFTRPHEENPGHPGRWANLRETLDIVLHDTADPETHEIDHEAIRPRLADEGKTAQFLATKGEVLTPEAMGMFLDAVLNEFREALNLLERRAVGDYSPDQHLQTLPAYNSHACPTAMMDRNQSSAVVVAGPALPEDGCGGLVNRSTMRIASSLVSALPGPRAISTAWWSTAFAFASSLSGITVAGTRP
jgi:hypothetical protein